MKYDVIDISNWQDVFDLAAVYTETECVYHHASQGTGFVTPGYRTRREQAQILSRPFGSYLFMEPGPALPQVSLFKSVVGSVASNDPRPMLDVELSGITAIECRRAMEMLWEWTSHPPFLYGGMNLLCHLAREEPALLQAPLWFAWYPDDVSFVTRLLAQFTKLRLGGFRPEPWETPTLWQYSSTQSIAGIRNRVDVNKYWNNVSLADVLLPSSNNRREAEKDMWSIIPDWIVDPVEGATSHYRVVNTIGGACFQALGLCQVTEQSPDPANGRTEILLGTTIDKITGLSMAKAGQQVVVTGLEGNTWNFHTGQFNPILPVDAQAIVEQVLTTIAARIRG